MRLTRTITFDILEGAHNYSTVGLLGSRQSGKTKLAQLIFKEHAYVSLEDIEARTTATNNPRAFLNANRNDAGLIVDDFHHVPDLITYMGAHEGRGSHPGTFILCGPQTQSAQELLTSNLTSTISIHTLHALSLQELSANYLLPHDLNDVLYKGLLPAVYTEQSDPRVLIAKSHSQFIDRDIRLQGQVDNLTAFHTFMVQCARNVGEMVNLTTLAQNSAISDHTARRWLTLLEEHQLVFLVKPYHTDFGKRVVKSPKLYFYDPGLVSMLLKADRSSLINHPLRVKIFENLVMSELAKWSTQQRSGSQLYFWRDKTDHEITCLIEEANKVVPVIISEKVQQSYKSEELAYWYKISGAREQCFLISDEEYHKDASSVRLNWRFIEPLLTFF